MHDVFTMQLFHLMVFLSGLQVYGMFMKTQQADNSKAVKTFCQKLFKKNCAVKVLYSYFTYVDKKFLLNCLMFWSLCIVVQLFLMGYFKLVLFYRPILTSSFLLTHN